MTTSDQFISEETGTFGSFDQFGIVPLPYVRLLEVHGFNPNADGYYLGFIQNRAIAPVAGLNIQQPIWVPGLTEFSWVPYGIGYPIDEAPGTSVLWWVVSTTYNVWTVPAVDFYVSGTLQVIFL